MVNFSPLAAEIGLPVWGTPANFNGFRVLAALLHGSQVVGISQTAALNRWRHLCTAGRPSRWALAHISSLVCISSLKRKHKHLHLKYACNRILFLKQQCTPVRECIKMLKYSGHILTALHYCSVSYIHNLLHVITMATLVKLRCWQKYGEFSVSVTASLLLSSSCSDDGGLL